MSPKKKSPITNDVQNHYELIGRDYKDNKNSFNKRTDMNTLFRGVILGPSNSGKNNLLIEFLKRSPHIYSHLHIICRNREQPFYNYLADKLEDFITFYDIDDIPTVDDLEEDGTLQLVVIDDFSNDAKLQKEVFSHYFIRGRHKKLSTLFLTHAYHMGTNKIIRLNSDYVMILKANSKRDLKMILADFNIPEVGEDRFYQFYKECTAKKGDFLMIDNVRSEIKHNFLDVLSK
jgi:AAA+ ATPase superfamily predicted ATPase